jgi:glutamate 5-kinase
MKVSRAQIINKAKRVVVKIGSSVIRAAAKDDALFTSIADSILAFKAAGRDVAIVSSGSIAMGAPKLGLSSAPRTIPERQAAAALGQVGLMGMYAAAFSGAKEQVAQVLLTHGDLSDRKRFINARNTMLTLLRLGIVPVINENDTVAVDELKFGDNDELAAMTVNLIEADLLIILTDTDGLYDADPTVNKGAVMLPLVEDVDSLKLDWLGGPRSGLGTGGMKTKVEAARKAAHYGAATIIANGFTRSVLAEIFSGADVGTLILPRVDKLTSRKHWIAFSSRLTGRVIVDDGAVEALLKGGKSLLPTGIKGVDGGFEAGEVVCCIDSKGREFARGVSNYSLAEIEKIKGKKSARIEELLGYKVYDEVIHRDNLVVL